MAGCMSPCNPAAQCDDFHSPPAIPRGAANARVNRAWMRWSVIWPSLQLQASYDMKTNPHDQRDWHERRIEEAREQKVAPEPTKDSAHGRPVKGGAPESRGS